MADKLTLELITDYIDNRTGSIPTDRIVAEYARERAAREACCQLGPRPGLVSLTEHSNADETTKWEADWITPFHVFASSGFQESPTAAYLALAEALRGAK